MLARMERKRAGLVGLSQRAPTPIQISFGWADDFGLAHEPSALVALAERLRATRLLFAARLEEGLAGLGLL